MKNIIISALILAVVAPAAFIFNSTALASSCVETLIYAQDYERAAYSLPNDTAVIKNRNGSTIVTLKQRSDDYVIWPSTYTVEVKDGDVLRYTGVGHHRLVFDIVDSDYDLIERVDSANRGGNFSVNIYNDGFVRFNSGEKAMEYNKLTLCGSNANTTSSPLNNDAPVWSQTSDKNAYVGQNLQFSIYATDSDGDSITYSVLYLPSGASFNSNSRVFNWTPNNNQIGNYQVVFRASDGSEYSDMTVTIYVSQDYNPPYYPPYNPPTQTPIFVDFNPPLTAREGQVYTATIRATSGNLPITYRVVSGPSGMIINERLGVIIWVPNFTQGGSTYTVNIGASNGTLEATRVFYVTVEDVNFVIPTPPVYVPPKPAPEAPLKIYDISIDRQEKEDVVVLFKTNYPAYGEVMYDLISQADKTKNFTYAYTAVGSGNQTTNHSVNLGNLDGDRNYYLRAVAKRGDNTAVSQEIALIQVNNDVNYMAFILGFFNWLVSPWLLWLIVIILLILLLLSYRRQNKILIDNRQYHRPSESIQDNIIR